jgi:hypothetical protein
MKHICKLALAISLAGALSGCATLLDDDNQEITVNLMCNDKPIRGQCIAENSRGKWVFRAPSAVQVKNEFGDLDITCKPAYLPQFTVSVPAIPSWNLAGNLLIGGVIGAAYDVHKNTGLKYPETVNISSPTCK